MSRSPHRRAWRRSMAVLAAAAAVALSAVTVSPASAAGATSYIEMTPALEAKVQKIIDDFRALHTVSGISAAVVTPDPNSSDPVITTFVAGEPSFGAGTPITPTTQFELGSETKTFTGDLLAYLIADGRVGLDDLVQDYAPLGITVPQFVDPGTGISTPITLRDLATHQAGLPDRPTNFDDGCAVPGCANPRPGYTQTMMWDGIQAQSLLWAPGTNWLYSNWGFGMLGTILSQVVAPVPIADPPAYQLAVDEAFVVDLGMSSTILEPLVPTIATPYTKLNVPAFLWHNTNAMSGAGGLISNADDMALWVAAHLGYNTAGAPLGVRTMVDSLQPASTITTRCSTAVSCQPTSFQMGFAWQLYDATHRDMGAPWAFKDGGTQGSSTDTMLAPTLRTGVTTMFNQQRDGNDGVAHAILQLLIASQTTVLPPTGSGGDGVLVVGLGAVALMGLGCVLSVRRRGTARA